MPFDFEKDFVQPTVKAVEEINAGGPILDSMPEHVGGYRDAAVVVSIKPKKTLMELVFDYHYSSRKSMFEYIFEHIKKAMEE